MICPEKGDCIHLVNNLTKLNPCKGAKIPKKQLTFEDIERDVIGEKYLESEGLREFLEAVIERALYGDKEAFYLIAFSRLRPGELCALKWTDINFKTRELRITKTLYIPKNNMYNYELTPPKTVGSIRTVELDKSIISMLKEYKKTSG